MAKHAVSFVAVIVGLLSPVAISGVRAQSSVAVSAPESHSEFSGVWILTGGEGRSLDRDTDREERREGARGRRGGGGGGLGGGARGGRGGAGVGARGGGDRAARAETAEATLAYVRTLGQPSRRLTVVVHAASVVFTLADGRVETLQTDNRKSEHRVENGLVKLTQRARWDGETLISNIEIDGGPKIERTYDVTAGGAELRIATRISGIGGRSGDQSRAFVYERPAD